ncbi:MAG: hypothetical protein U1G08_10700 [Verrucomicrobiota bacterium]
MKLSRRMLSRSCHAGVGVNILVGLSLCLCALVVFQWVVQSRLRALVETERAERSKVMGERQELESRSARYAEEIKHIEEMRSHLESERATNTVELKRVKGELVQLRSGFGSFSNLAFGYSNALVQANSNLVVQNGRMKDMAASANKAMEQRNETTVKYNESMTKYAELVTNYNALVTRFESYQKEVKEMLAKQKEGGK